MFLCVFSKKKKKKIKKKIKLMEVENLCIVQRFKESMEHNTSDLEEKKGLFLKGILTKRMGKRRGNNTKS